MKTFAISLAAAVVLAAGLSSPAVADVAEPNVLLRSGSSCLPNAVRCDRGTRPQHKRCFTVAVRDHTGSLRKRRVCRYYY